MFYLNNLDVRQSRQTNDGASIVRRAQERFRNNEMLKEARHLTWPLAALSLAFHYCEIFLWPALQC